MPPIDLFLVIFLFVPMMVWLVGPKWAKLVAVVVFVVGLILAGLVVWFFLNFKG